MGLMLRAITEEQDVSIINMINVLPADHYADSY